MSQSARRLFICDFTLITVYFSSLLILFSISLSSSGQNSELSEIIVTIAEELAADESDPESVSAYIERLHELSEEPVKINSAGEVEISKLFFLSDFQVKSLVDYSHSTGKIVSVYEIINIPGFDKETTELMIPFITLDDNLKTKQASGLWKNSLLTNIYRKPDDEDTSSLGSGMKLLNKYKFSAGGFIGGLTVEKDPGEKFFSGDPFRPDFMSTWLAYNGKGIIRKIIIGDYSARSGQGTNLNTGIRTGISLTAPGYLSAGNEIKPYTSTDENNFLRGFATELSAGNLDLFLFYSKNLIDASISSLSGTSSKEYVENFYTTGLHNTSSLMLKKDAVTDIACGISLSYDLNNLKIGLIWSEDRFSLPVKSSGREASDLFEFSGDKNTIYTVYYNSLINKIMLFGELSLNESSSFAIVQGISIRLANRLKANCLFRNYEPGYFSFHGKGPGSSSSDWNEKSILGNFTLEAARHLFISAGCDIRQFPWLRYRCSAPSQATRYELRTKYMPYENLIIEALYNFRLSTVDAPESGGIPEQIDIRTNYTKASARYSPINNLTLATRLDYKSVNSGNRGMLLLQDASYKFSSIPVTFWFRYCIFHTDAWDSRLYTYENDLLYNFSIPALSGEGNRCFAMVKLELSDMTVIRLKYSVTSIAGKRRIENRDEIRFQIKILF